MVFYLFLGRLNGVMNMKEMCWDYTYFKYNLTLFFFYLKTSIEGDYITKSNFEVRLFTLIWIFISTPFHPSCNTDQGV